MIRCPVVDGEDYRIAEKEAQALKDTSCIESFGQTVASHKALRGFEVIYHGKKPYYGVARRRSATQ